MSSFCFWLRPKVGPPITGLLLSVPASNKSEANVIFGKHKLQPLYHRGDVTVTGYPRVVKGPFGSAISLTKLDRVVYRFDVSEPFPCPFDILQCQDGFTLSLWIQLKNVTQGLHRVYLKLGNNVILKKYIAPHVVRFNALADNYKWYNEVYVAEKWIHIAVIWKLTESFSYMNGQKMFKYAPGNPDISVVSNNELQFSSDSNPGDFSIGNVELWSGAKSPLFIWRLYQEGLLDM